MYVIQTNNCECVCVCGWQDNNSYLLECTVKLGVTSLNLTLDAMAGSAY